MGLSTVTNKLATQTVSSSFDQLLYLDSEDGIEEATLKIVSAELGHSALQIAAEKVLVKSTDTDQAAAFEVQQADNTSIFKVDATTLDVTLGDDLLLNTDGCVIKLGAGADFTITHDGDAGATLAGSPITITAGEASTWSTGAGALTISGSAGVNIQENEATIIGIDTSRNITTTNTAQVDLDCSGSFSINSTGGVLNIGNDAVAQAINIGTGAAARVITMGNVTGATQVVLNAGTAGISLASTGAGDITINSDDTLLLDADGVLELNSTGAISIGNDNNDFTINIGTAGTRTLNVGINDGDDLTTIAVNGPVTIDRNTAGDSAENGKGLYVDFDRSVATSGTAAHNDIGIDLDVNSASLGTSSVIGMDIDVVGATSGTHTATGLTVDVSGGDTNIAALFNGGYVGIGETAPNGDLHIRGSSYATFVLEDSGAGSNQKEKTIRSDGGLLQFGKWNDGGGTMEVLTTMDNNGSWGIGVGTPGHTLTLNASNDTTIAVTTCPSLGFHNEESDSAITTGDYLGIIDFGARDESAAFTYRESARIAVLAAAEWTNDAQNSAGKIQFHTQDEDNADSIGTVRMIIDQDGKVGIGTASPSTTFVATSAINTASFDGDDADCLAIFTNSQDTDNAGGTYIKLDSTRAGENMGIVFDSNDNSDSNFQIWDNRGGTGFCRLNIDQNGLVGFGTITPAHGIHVKNVTEGVNIFIDSDSGYDAQLLLGDSGNATWAIAHDGASAVASNALLIKDLSGDVIVYLTQDANGTNTSAWVNGSDERMKRNIVPIEDGALEKLNTLRCSEFNFIYHTENQKRAGLLAQDVYKVFPHAVVGDPSLEYKYTPKTDTEPMKNENALGLCYQDMITPMIKAIQELSAEVDKLKGDA